jgi:tctex1 domain-containing protein 2
MADLNTIPESIHIETNINEKPSLVTRTALSRYGVMNSNFMSSNGIVATGHTPSLRSRRQSSRTSMLNPGVNRRCVRYENSYRMEPDDEQKINIARLSRCASNLIDTAMSGYVYDVSQVKSFLLSLADRIRSQMKQLVYSRYKIIVQVCVGERKHQDLRITSRCIWDTKCDRHFTITKKLENVFITATIFCVYTE